MKKNLVAGLLVSMALAMGSPSTHAAVGNTQGIASVTPNGSASYSIPIFTPPGTHGMQPSLSLDYSSASRSGWVGYGWSIGGLSSIYRCSKTWAQDGESRSVRLDLSDRYCLDGNRLRLVLGAHGGTGAEYRTEIESFTRVMSYGSAGNGPGYFIAEMKNGLIYEYGNTADSRIESQGVTTARAWAVNAIRDRGGNAILFRYTEDATTGSYRLADAQYTSNPGQGLSAAYKVEFVYETQPPDEIDSSYWGGRLIQDTVRLTRVDVTYNADLVRRYNLTYEPSLSNTGKSRVASLLECAGSAGTECFPATSFTYSNGTPGVTGAINTAVGASTSRWVTDVNGDGRDDIVYSSGSSGSGSWMIMFASGSGYAVPVNTGVANTNYTQAIRIDYNADGLGDMLVPYSGGTWWVLQGTTTGFAAPLNTGTAVTTTGTGVNARALDINGDGLQDLVWADLVGFVGGDAIRYRLRELSGTFSASVSTLVGPMVVDSMISSPVWGLESQVHAGEPDFNGDGRSDLLYRRVDRVFVDGPPSFWQHTYFTVAVSPGATSSGYVTTSPSTPPTYADFNGDGATDVMYVTSATTSAMRFGTGTGFTGSVLAPHSAQGLWVTYDWDGDGYDDVLYRNPTSGTWNVSRCTGQSFALATATDISSSDTMIVSDINGDGLLDLTYPSGGTWHYRLHAGSRADTLSSVTDGFGNVTSFYYTSVAQSSYHKFNLAAYPEQDYGGTMSVVYQMTAPDGIGGTYSRAYVYYGARLNLQGRGFEGFEGVRTQDTRNGLLTYEFFRQLFPYTGLMYQSDLYQPDGTTLISRVEQTWSSQSYNPGTEGRELAYVSTSTQRQYEVGGTYNGALLSTTGTTSLLHAATGSMYDRTVTTTEASGANGVLANTSYTSRTRYPTADLTNATSTWCIGQPGRIEVTNSHGDYGGAELTRTTEVNWDTTKCRPDAIIAEPGNSTLQVTRALGYDGFGNVSSETVTGIGMPARATAYNWGATGQFLTWTDNALMQRTEMTWDHRFGLLSSSKDPNGLQTSWQYDAFGRRNYEVRPDETISTWVMGTAAGPLCAPTARYFVQETDYTKLGTEIRRRYVFVDSFDRPVNEYLTAFDGASYDTVTRDYDALGRVRRQSVPYSTPGCQGYLNPSPTQYAYDLLDRPTQVSRPVSDSDPTLQTTYIYYEGLRSRVVDPLSKQTSQTLNVLGATVRSADHGGYAQNFAYDAFGNLVRVTDTLANPLQSNVYNLRGVLTSQSDMDRGAWTFTANALGEVVSQLDANGVTTTFQYDLLGRLRTRIAPDAGQSITTTWQWGNSAAAKNTGQLEYVDIAGTTIVGNRETYTYDSRGRLSQTQYSGGGTDYYVNRSYSEATGFLDTLTYPQSIAGYRLKLQYEYQAGRLLRVRDFNAPTTVFWQANAMDARNNVLDEQLGNGIRSIRGYDQVTGALDYLQSGPNADGTLQNLSYSWDRVGNLTERQDQRQSITEHFYYDDLHRLDYSTLNGTTNLDLSYDAMGNILTKTGVGTYTYHATKKHAVVATSTPSRAFSYNDNGNQISRSGFSVSWYPFNLPKQINATGTNSSTFNYNGNGGRWNQVAVHSGVSETTTYIGGLMEVVVRLGATNYRHYIAGGTGTVAEHIRGSSGTNTTRYLTKDHLGSPDSITGSTGSVIVRMSYGAHGARRNEAGWSGAVPSADQTNINGNTRRGFTEHDMLDNLQLVHMNGRVFDWVTGRFISADPYIDGAGNTQRWNRYSYVGNNPLSMMDPTGFSTIDLTGFGGCRSRRCVPDGQSRWHEEVFDQLDGGWVSPDQPNFDDLGRGSESIDQWFNAMLAWTSMDRHDMLSGIRRLSTVPHVRTYSYVHANRAPLREIINLPWQPRDAASSVGSTVGGAGQLALNDYVTLLGNGYYERVGVDIGQGMTLMVPTRIYASSDPIAAAGLQRAEEVLGVVAAGTLIVTPGPEDLVIAGGLAARGITTVIGRTRDLKNLAVGERSLLDRLTPNLGSPRANWQRNAGVLRQEMRRGLPIRDASPGDTGGVFLNAERALLIDRGWTFNPQTGYWMPPGL